MVPQGKNLCLNAFKAEIVVAFDDNRAGRGYGYVPAYSLKTGERFMRFNCQVYSFLEERYFVPLKNNACIRMLCKNLIFIIMVSKKEELHLHTLMLNIM